MWGAAASTYTAPRMSTATAAIAVVALCAAAVPARGTLLPNGCEMDGAVLVSCANSTASVLRFELQGIREVAVGAFYFNGAVNVTTVALSYAFVVELPEGVFDPLENLQHLSLDNTRLRELPLGVFQELDALSSLDLSNSRISSLHEDTFKSQAELVSLRLDGNALQHIDSGTFRPLSSLEELSLAGNHLVDHAADMFSSLERLQRLDLSDMRLTYLRPGLFDGLSSLEVLWLNDNRLSWFPDGVFDAVVSLSELDLSGNLWPADCDSAGYELQTVSTSIGLMWYCVGACAQHCVDGCEEGTGVCNACAPGSHRTADGFCQACYSTACTPEEFEVSTCQQGGNETVNRECALCTTCASGTSETVACQDFQDETVDRECSEEACSQSCASCRGGSTALDCRVLPGAATADCAAGYSPWPRVTPGQSTPTATCAACPLRYNCLRGGRCLEGADPESPMCGRCLPGFYSLIRSCHPCPDVSWVPIVLSFIAFAFVVVGSGLLRPRAMQVLRHITLHCQMLSVWFSLNVPWPDWLVEFVQSVQSLFGFDFAFFGPACAIGGTWYVKLAAAVALPVLVVSLILAARAVAGAKGRQQERGSWAAQRWWRRQTTATQLLTLVLLVSYLPTVRTMLEALACHDTPAGLVLGQDTQIKCDEAGHVAVMVCCGIVVAVLAFALPIALALRIRTLNARDELLSHSSAILLRNLYEPYKLEHHAPSTEALLLFHRATGVSIQVMLESGPLQSTLGLVTTLLVLAFILSQRPYKEAVYSWHLRLCCLRRHVKVRDFLNRVAIASAASQVLAILLGLASTALNADSDDARVAAASKATSALGVLAAIVVGGTAAVLIAAVINVDRLRRTARLVCLCGCLRKRQEFDSRDGSKYFGSSAGEADVPWMSEMSEAHPRPLVAANSVFQLLKPGEDDDHIAAAERADAHRRTWQTELSVLEQALAAVLSDLRGIDSSEAKGSRGSLPGTPDKTNSDTTVAEVHVTDAASARRVALLKHRDQLTAQISQLKARLRKPPVGEVAERVADITKHHQPIFEKARDAAWVAVAEAGSGVSVAAGVPPMTVAELSRVISDAHDAAAAYATDLNTYHDELSRAEWIREALIVHRSGSSARDVMDATRALGEAESSELKSLFHSTLRSTFDRRGVETLEHRQKRAAERHDWRDASKAVAMHRTAMAPTVNMIDAMVSLARAQPGAVLSTSSRLKVQVGIDRAPLVLDIEGMPRLHAALLWLSEAYFVLRTHGIPETAPARAEIPTLTGHARRRLEEGAGLGAGTVSRLKAEYASTVEQLDSAIAGVVAAGQRRLPEVKRQQQEAATQLRRALKRAADWSVRDYHTAAHLQLLIDELVEASAASEGQ